MRKRSQFEEINEAKLAFMSPDMWLWWRAYQYSKDPDRVTYNYNIEQFGPADLLTTEIAKSEIPKPRLDFTVTFSKSAR